MNGRGQRGQQNRHQKRLGPTVHQQSHGGLGHRGALHQRHDLGVTGGRTHLFNQHVQRAADVVAARNHPITHLALQRQRLAREQSLVNLGSARHNAAISCKRLSRQHLDHIAHRQAANRQQRPRPIGLALAHAVGQPVHDRFQRPRCAVAQAQLQPATAQQKKHKHGERVKKDFAAKGAIGLEGAQRADPKSHHHAQRHRQIHADLALAQIAPGIAQKWLARKKHHRQRQHPGSPTQQKKRLLRNITRCRQVGRCGVHHDLHHAKPRHRPTPDHAARLIASALVGMGVVGRQGLIAVALHRTHPFRRPRLLCRPDNLPPVAGPADLHRGHARHAAQRVF